MKLACIWNVFDGLELLKGAMQCVGNNADLHIMVWQEVSNYGEHYNPRIENIGEATLKYPNSPLREIVDAAIAYPHVYHKYNPTIHSGATNERAKRNIGIDIARERGCTHFVLMDADEYYTDFGEAKQAYINSGAKGSVCKIFTYFKKPTLRFETEDNYYVPFIHELKPETITGVKHYPFYVDPTRRINETNVALLDVHMHHFSWVRKDIERKVRNSSAKGNIQRSQLLQDYYSDLKHGSCLHDYGGMRLIKVPNHFGIEIETLPVQVRT